MAIVPSLDAARFCSQLQTILREEFDEDDGLSESCGLRVSHRVFDMDTLGNIFGCGITFRGTKFIGQAPKFCDLKELRDNDQSDLVLNFLRGEAQCEDTEKGAKEAAGINVYLFMCRLDEIRAYVRVEGIKIDEDLAWDKLHLCEKC